MSAHSFIRSELALAGADQDLPGDRKIAGEFLFGACGVGGNLYNGEWKGNKMKSQKPIIPVRKMKGDGHFDFYDCRQCGRRWKSTDKKIGHVRCPKGKW